MAVSIIFHFQVGFRFTNEVSVMGPIILFPKYELFLKLLFINRKYTIRMNFFYYFQNCYVLESG